LAGKGRSGRGKGKLFLRSSGRRKALKGGPQECRELKEALGGRGRLETTERVAKPCGWYFRDTWQRVLDALSSRGSEKKGAPIRNAEGAKSSSEAFLSARPSSVDQGLEEATAELGGKTLKGGVEVHGRIIRWGYLPGPPVTENPRVWASADRRTG
jgi:hypothetical protein